MKAQPPSHTAHATPEAVHLNDWPEPAFTGGDFNLIRMVEEHGPLRIQEIQKELQEISNRMSRLEVEKGTLERLVAATK